MKSLGLARMLTLKSNCLTFSLCFLLPLHGQLCLSHLWEMGQAMALSK